MQANGHGARTTPEHEGCGRHGRSLTPPSPSGRGRIGARSRRDFHGKDRVESGPLPPATAQVTGLVLAGGRGLRWGGRDKGLIEYRGRPLVAWVLDALAPQVGQLLISANRNLDLYAAFGQPLVSDQMDDFQGPLAGVAAALALAETPWLVTAPCDGPALPPDLVARLSLALAEQRGSAAAVQVEGRIQPVYALIPVSRAQDLAAYLGAGGRSVRGWLERQPLALADFSDRAQAFANLNSPESCQLSVVSCQVSGVS